MEDSESIEIVMRTEDTQPCFLIKSKIGFFPPSAVLHFEKTEECVRILENWRFFCYFRQLIDTFLLDKHLISLSSIIIKLISLSWGTRRFDHDSFAV